MYAVSEKNYDSFECELVFYQFCMKKNVSYIKWFLKILISIYNYAILHMMHFLFHAAIKMLSILK